MVKRFVAKGLKAQKEKYARLLLTDKIQLPFHLSVHRFYKVLHLILSGTC